MNVLELEFVSCSQWGMFPASETIDDECACERAAQRRQASRIKVGRVVPHPTIIVAYDEQEADR